MTHEQLKHWEDFALRMARTVYPAKGRPGRAWIVQTVEEFFASLDEDDVASFQNWNDAEGRGYAPCDSITRFLESCMNDWMTCCPSCLESCMNDWMTCCPSCSDGAYEDCRCDEIEEICYDQWQGQWGDPVRCCLRAGIDAACQSGPGVTGFTAGDVRAMFPEGVPDWVFDPAEEFQDFASSQRIGTFAELSDSTGVML